MSPAEELNNKLETLKQRLPRGWQELAIEKRAFTRARQIKSPKDLLRAVFSYAIADYSLREVAGVLTSQHKWMSDQAVYERLSKCALWLETLVAAMLFEKAKQVAIETRRLKIVDATTLNSPGASGTDHRLHLCYEPMSQSSCGVKLTDVKGAERFTHFEYEPLDIVLGDRIYSKAKHIIAVTEQGADVIVRANFQQLRLYTLTGEIVDWKAALIKAQDAGSLSLEAYVADEAGKHTKVYLHSQRLGAAEIEKARRHIKKSAYDKGHKTREATLLACEWITILTTIAPTDLSPALIFELYRIRWQIELYIKRLKSILKLGQIRAKRGSLLARVHVLAKMLYALLIERIAEKRLGVEWTQMTRQRRGTWFRLWRMMRDEFIEAVICTVRWKDEDWRLRLRVVSERRRQRKLQRLPQEVIRWLKEGASREPAKSSNRPSVLHLAA